MNGMPCTRKMSPLEVDPHLQVPTCRGQTDRCSAGYIWIEKACLGGLSPSGGGSPWCFILHRRRCIGNKFLMHLRHVDTMSLLRGLRAPCIFSPCSNLSLHPQGFLGGGFRSYCRRPVSTTQRMMNPMTHPMGLSSTAVYPLPPWYVRSWLPSLPPTPNRVITPFTYLRTWTSLLHFIQEVLQCLNLHSCLLKHSASLQYTFRRVNASSLIGVASSQPIHRCILEILQVSYDAWGSITAEVWCCSFQYSFVQRQLSPCPLMLWYWQWWWWWWWQGSPPLIALC